MAKVGHRDIEDQPSGHNCDSKGQTAPLFRDSTYIVRLKYYGMSKSKNPAPWMDHAQVVKY